MEEGFFIFAIRSYEEISKPLPIEGDTYFPQFQEELFIKEVIERFDGEIPYSYITYTRKKN